MKEDTRILGYFQFSAFETMHQVGKTLALLNYEAVVNGNPLWVTTSLCLFLQLCTTPPLFLQQGWLFIDFS